MKSALKRLPAVLLALAMCAVVLWALWRTVRVPEAQQAAGGPASKPKATESQIQSFCGVCHRFPQPDILPTHVWEQKITNMYELAGADDRVTEYPPIQDVVEYYTTRAPEKLELPAVAEDADGGPVPFAAGALSLGEIDRAPAVTQIRIVQAPDSHRPRLLLSEMRFGRVLDLDPGRVDRRPASFGYFGCPAHAEPVDLDQDGIRDLLIANLGTFLPSDDRRGSVIWLRGNRNGSFLPHPVIETLGRVADAQAADFDQDGDLDLVVAEFGWRKVGGILYLENESPGSPVPRFEPYILDTRTGTIAVPVVDLNQDGRPDFVALISQESETVVAFLNVGAGRFEKLPIYAADHPDWGYSAMRVADLDRDGDLDLVVVNGDTLDDTMAKPYHGVSWLENRGDSSFVHHRLADLPGATGLVVGDLDGDEDLDVVATAWLPFLDADAARQQGLPAVIWLEQTPDRRFRRHVLRRGPLYYPAVDLGDYDGDGDQDLVLGAFTFPNLFGHGAGTSALLLRNRTHEP